MISLQLTQLTVQTKRTEWTFYHEMSWNVIWLYRKPVSVEETTAPPASTVMLVRSSVCPKIEAK
jgi:hypothetical protein